jgi:hypothetical protein
VRQLLRRLGAVLIACTLIALVACDLAVSGFGTWWDAHGLTTSVVSSLLIVGATALIFDEVVAYRQRKDRGLSVAAQALIVYGQAREAYQAVMASDDSASGAPSELRDLASNLLVAAPSLFDDPAARVFLLQVDQLMSALVEAVAQSGRPPDAQNPDAQTSDHLTDLMAKAQQAYEPLLARFPPDYQSRLGALSQLARDPVQESEDRDDLAVLPGDGHVGADDERLTALRPESPGETGLPMVGVDRAGQGEDEPGELPLHRGDRCVDGAASVGFRERVDVFGAGRPGPIDQFTARGRVRFVPAIEIAGDHVVHGVSLPG